MPVIKRVVFWGSLSLVVVLCCSWGFLVHRTVAQLAVYQLPKKMRPFFYKNLGYLVKESVRPDLRRNTDPSENAKHFIDLEMYGDSAAWKMPLLWDDAVRIYTKDTLLTYGYVPYIIVMEKDRLIQAFREGNKDSILFYATDLGHYIGDAHVPLHTSSNYDGQFTHQKGLHNLWETIVPEIKLDEYNLTDHHQAVYISNPAEAIWGAVRDAHALLPQVFGKEREVSRSFPDSSKYRVEIRKGKTVQYYTGDFAKAYSQHLGNTINRQLQLSADMIADFWYTAWVDAGKPNLDHLLTSPFVRTDRKELKKERKAYRRNELLEKKAPDFKTNRL